MNARLVSTQNVRWFVTETLVIVIGVLIAIAVDDFWNDQQELRLEIDYIRRLQEDLESERRYLEQVRFRRRELKRAALETILPVIHGQEPVPDDVVEFLHNVSRGGIGSASAIEPLFNTTFDDLRATGNLRLISDAELRSVIVRHYASNEFEALRLQGRSTGYVAFVHSVMPAELRDDIDLAALNEFGLDYALERLLSDEFRSLANQEYNRLLFLEGMRITDFNGLIERLAAYQGELEASLLW
ncbi:MAG: hypothetical protein R3192_07165 [Woeseiaceae bacterium]|nr:hypothetical protein [Woeseiaceae bacterium]